MAELHQFLCMLPVAVAQSFCDSIVIHYLHLIYDATFWYHGTNWCTALDKIRSQGRDIQVRLCQSCQYEWSVTFEFGRVRHNVALEAKSATYYCLVEGVSGKVEEVWEGVLYDEGTAGRPTWTIAGLQLFFLYLRISRFVDGLLAMWMPFLRLWNPLLCATTVYAYLIVEFVKIKTSPPQSQLGRAVLPPLAAENGLARCMC